MIYTLKRDEGLYRYKPGEAVKTLGGPGHDAEKGDRFRLIGWAGDFAILHKDRGLKHGEFFAVPMGSLKDSNIWSTADEG